MKAEPQPEDRGPCSRRQSGSEATASAFGPFRALSGLHDAHPQGEGICFPQSPVQMLVSAQTLPDTPRAGSLWPGGVTPHERSHCSVTLSHVCGQSSTPELRAPPGRGPLFSNCSLQLTGSPCTNVQGECVGWFIDPVNGCLCQYRVAPEKPGEIHSW